MTGPYQKERPRSSATRGRQVW